MPQIFDATPIAATAQAKAGKRLAAILVAMAALDPQLLWKYAGRDVKLVTAAELVELMARKRDWLAGVKLTDLKR